MKSFFVRDLRSGPVDVALTAEEKAGETSSRALQETSAAGRRSRAVAAVSKVQQQSIQRGLTGDFITQQEIDSEIAAVRRARREGVKDGI